MVMFRAESGKAANRELASIRYFFQIRHGQFALRLPSPFGRRRCWDGVPLSIDHGCGTSGNGTTHSFPRSLWKRQPDPFVVDERNERTGWRFALGSSRRWRHIAIRHAFAGADGAWPLLGKAVRESTKLGRTNAHPSRRRQDRSLAPRLTIRPCLPTPTKSTTQCWRSCT